MQGDESGCIATVEQTISVETQFPLPAAPSWSTYLACVVGCGSGPGRSHSHWSNRFCAKTCTGNLRLWNGLSSIVVCPASGGRKATGPWPDPPVDRNTRTDINRAWPAGFRFDRREAHRQRTSMTNEDRSRDRETGRHPRHERHSGRGTASGGDSFRGTMKLGSPRTLVAARCGGLSGGTTSANTSCQVTV